MNLAPVIQRELISEARNPWQAWTRPGTALLLGAILALIVHSDRSLSPARLGEVLFTVCNTLLIHCVWVGAALATADCVRREKTERTLSLLFLTPLRPVEIVLGKSILQGLRGLVLVVAAMPVLVIPFLFGGVEWEDAVVAAALHLGMLLGAVGVGLVASSSTSGPMRARVTALLMAAAVFSGGVVLAHEMFGIHDGWIKLQGSWRSGVGWAWGWRAAMFPLAGLGVLGLGAWQAGWHVASFWREEAVSAGRLRDLMFHRMALVGGIAVVGLAGILLWQYSRYGSRAIEAFCVLSYGLAIPACGLLLPCLVAGWLFRIPEPEVSLVPGRRRWLWLWLWRGLVTASGLFLLAIHMGWPAHVWFAQWLRNMLVQALLLTGMLLVARMVQVRTRDFLLAVCWTALIGLFVTPVYCFLEGLSTHTLMRLPLHLEVPAHESRMMAGSWFWGPARTGFLQALFFPDATRRAGGDEMGAWVAVHLAGLAVLGGLHWKAVPWFRARWDARFAGKRSAVGQGEATRGLKHSFCRPIVAVSRLRSGTRSMLDRHPIRWLGQHHWLPRAGRWFWLLVLICVETVVVLEGGFFHYNEDWAWFQLMLGCFLMGGLALAAAGSYRAERRAGALELICATPVSGRDLVGGRMRVLGWMFAPVLGVWLGLLWIVPLSWSGDASLGFYIPVTLALAGAVLAVAWFGVWTAFRFNHYLTSLAVTVLLAALVPVMSLMPFILGGVRWLEPIQPVLSAFGMRGESVFMLFNLVGYLLMALAGWWGLRRLLRNREFALGEGRD